MSFLRRVWAYIVRLPRLYSIGGALIIVALLVVGVHAATRAPAEDSTVSNISHVTISSVASLSSNAGPLPVTGKVTSLNQATILAQSSGEITSLNVSIGSRVGAGQIIASFENSSQAAAVLQAQGSYDAATVALTKASGTTATNAGVSSASAATNAANAAASLQASLQSTYSALDDAIHSKADTMFSNPRSVSPTLNLSVPDSQLVITLQNERSQLDSVIADAASNANGSSAANVTAMNADAQTVITFLNNLTKATNEALTSQSVSSATLAAYQASAGSARSEVVGAVSSLAAQKSAYDSAQSNAQTSANTAISGSQNDIAAAQANVKQALGALRSAQANLEKTVVRSPISGTIVSLPVTRGDFVAAFAQVAQVSNPGALEIDAYVTPDDAKTILVGGKATIDSTVAGIITSIAPALDPTTGKILVKIGITGSQATLTDGDTVTVALVRAQSNPTTTTHAAANTAGILIPLTAVKITPDDAQVFTVASSTLVAHPVTLGAILGEQVTVTEGLTLDMDIVTDARGLSDGQQVQVDQ